MLRLFFFNSPNGFLLIIILLVCFETGLHPVTQFLGWPRNYFVSRLALMTQQFPCFRSIRITGMRTTICSQQAFRAFQHASLPH